MSVLTLNGPETFASVLEAVHAAQTVDEVTPHITRLWFTPWRFDPGSHVLAREAAWLARTKPLGWGSLAGFEAGAGPTVLLVHGWGDYAARLGAFVDPLVDSGFRVVGLDLPGHGGSGDRPADLYQWADAIGDVIAAEKVHAIVAHSLGGQAVTNALTRGTGVEAVALLAPAVRLAHSVDTFARMFGLPALATEALREEIARRYGSGVWAETDGDAQARQLRLPALIVHSADDDQIGTSDVELLARAWDGAALIELDGLGHNRLTRDHAVIELVAEFLAQPRT
jgi:pimeloyl-ACP methyl ester carboxylesterase